MQFDSIHPNDKRPHVDYYVYLASREWALKKLAVAERSRGWCERCARAAAIDVHHKSYRHLGNEPLEDLIHICRACHDWEHGRIFVDPAEPLPPPMNEREWRDAMQDDGFRRFMGFLDEAS